MGFGLHCGWAIEGAIGSFYKIDASYLSPNVNMAARLEAATKQFGATILCSGQLVDIMTEKTREQLRIIDIVAVKGSIEPLELYTVDLDNTTLPLDPLGPKVNRKDAKVKRVRQRIARDKYRELTFDGQLQASMKFQTDQDIIDMRKPFTKVR
jgi:hypothetical protein